jgi:hypothetical protein
MVPNLALPAPNAGWISKTGNNKLTAKRRLHLMVDGMPVLAKRCIILS